MTETAIAIRNGVDTAKLFGTLDAVKAQPEIAKFTFRARNRWLDGAHNRSTIKDFYAACQEDESRASAFHLDAGEPQILIGEDTGPNPAEFLLHALAACLTTSLVYVAAARKVRLTEVSSTLEGEMDVRGALGLDDEVRNGFDNIRVSFEIKGDAPDEKLRELVARASQRSAVFDCITSGVPVHVEASVNGS
ncbi:MAG TPA: OsmC family protein [Gaiellaceae bacterium]